MVLCTKCFWEYFLRGAILLISHLLACQRFNSKTAYPYNPTSASTITTNERTQEYTGDSFLLPPAWKLAKKIRRVREKTLTKLWKQKAQWAVQFDCWCVNRKCVCCTLYFPCYGNASFRVREEIFRGLLVGCAFRIPSTAADFRDVENIALKVVPPNTFTYNDL